MQYIVAAKQAGQRLDVFLATATGSSRSSVTTAIKAGKVHVNNQPTKPSYLVVGEDRVSYDPDQEQQAVIGHVPDFPVAYEDTDLIIIEKPAGVAVHSSPTSPLLPTVADFARSVTSDPDHDRPGIVHRLDQDTSGLLIIAKSLESKQYMQQQFKDRNIIKHYIALVTGRLKNDAAEIKLNIGRDKKRPTRRAVDTHGKPAITTYKVVAVYPGYSLVEAWPQTGRTHQLRVHFAAIGHPIAGDKLYGAGNAPAGLSRQFLHATRLEFTGPSGKPIRVDSPLPQELIAILKSLSD